MTEVVVVREVGLLRAAGVDGADLPGHSRTQVPGDPRTFLLLG